MSTQRKQYSTECKALPIDWATQEGVGLIEKRLDLAPEAKRELIKPAHPHVSNARQCDLAPEWCR